MAKPIFQRYKLLDGNGEFLPDNAEMWEDRNGDYVKFEDVKEEFIAFGFNINLLKEHISRYYSSYEDKTLFAIFNELEKFYIEIRKDLK